MPFEAIYFSTVNEMFIQHRADTQRECLTGLFREAMKIEGVEAEMTDEELFECYKTTDTHDESLEQLRPCTEGIGNIAIIVDLGRMIVPVGFIRRIIV